MMQFARVIAVLLLSLGCGSTAFAEPFSAQYDEDITSSDVVQMDDSLQQLAISDADGMLDQYGTENNDSNDESDEDE